jgi:hypothetical protein
MYRQSYNFANINFSLYDFIGEKNRAAGQTWKVYAI